MSKLKNDNITRLYGHLNSSQSQYCFLYLEYVNGGEIFNQIIKYTYFSEDLSRHIIRQVATSVKYLHDIGIVHRDIKPENLLFVKNDFIPRSNAEKFGARRQSDDNNKVDEGSFIKNYGAGGIGAVKLADFGLSTVLYNDNMKAKTPCGTVGYTSPEQHLNLGYTKKVDIWAIGCVLYTLVVGFPPFYSNTQDSKDISLKVARGEYKFLAPWFDEVSSECKNLISNLLTVDPEKRYSVDQLLKDPWMSKGYEDENVTPIESTAADDAPAGSTFDQDLYSKFNDKLVTNSNVNDYFVEHNVKKSTTSQSHSRHHNTHNRNAPHSDDNNNNNNNENRHDNDKDEDQVRHNHHRSHQPHSHSIQYGVGGLTTPRGEAIKLVFDTGNVVQRAVSPASTHAMAMAAISPNGGNLTVLSEFDHDHDHEHGYGYGYDQGQQHATIDMMTLGVDHRNVNGRGRRHGSLSSMSSSDTSSVSSSDSDYDSDEDDDDDDDDYDGEASGEDSEQDEDICSLRLPVSRMTVTCSPSCKKVKNFKFGSSAGSAGTSNGKDNVSNKSDESSSSNAVAIVTAEIEDNTTGTRRKSSVSFQLCPSKKSSRTGSIASSFAGMHGSTSTTANTTNTTGTSATSTSASTSTVLSATSVPTTTTKTTTASAASMSSRTSSITSSILLHPSNSNTSTTASTDLHLQHLKFEDEYNPTAIVSDDNNNRCISPLSPGGRNGRVLSKTSTRSSHHSFPKTPKPVDLDEV
ncbi:unnamed protein product [Ambrosiozyma monospora]|uniref:Unnamed protein product n=1 Tax=Ambrosiozyma monospora TaxID=43982 RepID=A0A9W6Z5D0_AMBMO|nr:unnamed protein product [Ambrosiozyma monospora]